MKGKIGFLVIASVLFALGCIASVTNEAVAVEKASACPGVQTICVISPARGQSKQPVENSPVDFCNAGTSPPPEVCDDCCTWCANKNPDRIVGQCDCSDYSNYELCP